MDKNTVIGFILIAGILFGFTFYQSKQARKADEWQAQQDSIVLAERIAAGDTVISVVPVSPDSVSSAVIPVEAKEAIYKDAALEAAHSGEASFVTLENDKIALKLSSRGAQPSSVLVKDYFNYDSTALYIFKEGAAEYNVSVYAGEFISTRDFNFNIAEQTDSSVAFRLPFSDGGYIEQH